MSAQYACPRCHRVVPDRPQLVEWCVMFDLYGAVMCSGCYDELRREQDHEQRRCWSTCYCPWGVQRADAGREQAA